MHEKPLKRIERRNLRSRIIARKTSYPVESGWFLFDNPNPTIDYPTYDLEYRFAIQNCPLKRMHFIECMKSVKVIAASYANSAAVPLLTQCSCLLSLGSLISKTKLVSCPEGKS